MSSAVNVAAVVRRAFVLHGVALLTGLFAVGLVVDRVDRADGRFFAGLVLGWLLGVPLSLSRLRPWAVFVGGLVAGWCVGMAGIALNDGSSSMAFETFGVVWVGAQLGAASSYALLAPRLDVAALWLPLGLYVAAAVTWLNQHGAVSTWRRDKLAIWDAPSAGLVALGVVFFVLLLAARQRVSRARWASDDVRVDGPGVDVGARGRVVLLGVLLAAAVLVVAPFLLRTRAGCEDCSTAPSTTQPTASSSSSPPPPPPLDGDRAWAAAQRLLRAVGDVAGGVALAGGILAVAGVASLPLLRRRRLRALEEPAASLPPTERVRRRFRRAVVALHEAGVVVDGALVAPRGLMRAVADVDEAGGPRGLVEAVTVWEQVCFGGRGLPDDAETRMARAMGEVVAWAGARRSAWQALSSAFRLPSPTD